MKAINTVYRNIRFRSRNEAKWAVFMDHFCVPFEYEPEGFQLNGLRYLPDFYLTDQKIWAEVKFDQPTTIEIVKATRLATESGLPLVFLIFANDRLESVEHSGGPFYLPGGERHAQLAVWQICNLCDARSISPYAIAAGFECWDCGQKLSSEEVMKLADKGIDIFDEKALREPFIAARQARFEFGQTPQQPAPEASEIL